MTKTLPPPMDKEHELLALLDALKERISLIGEQTNTQSKIDNVENQIKFSSLENCMRAISMHIQIQLTQLNLRITKLQKEMDLLRPKQ